MSDSRTPLADALSKPIVIPDPEDGITVAVQAQQGQLGASVQADVDVGKPGGWSMGAMASWVQHAGYTALGWVTWRPAKK